MVKNLIKYPTREGLKVLPTSIENTNSDNSCGCCGTGKTIKITRSKKEMKEITNNQTTTVTAPEIVCGGCANSIKKAFGEVEGVWDAVAIVEYASSRFMFVWL